MIYDLHIHINPHADEGEIYEYEMYAKMLNIQVAGFVIHYVPTMPEKLLKNFRDVVSTFSVKAYTGVEIYYPATKEPSGFDYYLYHFSNIIVDAEILRRLESVIIAHPFAYGMKIDESAIPLMEKNNIAVECNSAHYHPKLKKFYNKLREYGIIIPFGSDAHTPGEMGSGFDELSDLISPLEKVENYLNSFD